MPHWASNGGRMQLRGDNKISLDDPPKHQQRDRQPGGEWQGNKKMTHLWQVSWVGDLGLLAHFIAGCKTGANDRNLPSRHFLCRVTATAYLFVGTAGTTVKGESARGTRSGNRQPLLPRCRGACDRPRRERGRGCNCTRKPRPSGDRRTTGQRARRVIDHRTDFRRAAQERFYESKILAGKPD